MNILTLTEFDKLETIADIRTALFADDTYTETTESTGDERGQLREVTVTRNLLTDEIVETRTIEWTYYGEDPNDPVDEITISKKDKDNKPLGKAQVVKHYKDKQPTVSLIAVAIER